MFSNNARSERAPKFATLSCLFVLTPEEKLLQFLPYMSSILAMKFVSKILLLLHHLTAARKSTVLWTKFLFLLPSPSTATSTSRSKIWTGILFLSQLMMGGASASSVFVLPSTELWTGSRVEVGCYTDLGKQVSCSQIQKVVVHGIGLGMLLLTGRSVALNQQ